MENQGMRSNAADGSAVPFPGGVMYLQPAARNKFDNYLHKQSVGLGTTQLVLGCLCIVFNAIALAIRSYYDISFVGHGFWCGVLFIVTGAIGISAGISKTKCKIIAYMVLCIISASFTAALLACGILGSFSTATYSDCNRYGYSYSYDYYYRPPCNDGSVNVAMEGCIAVCGFIAAILFIWGSTLACKAKVCNCCANTYEQQTMFVPFQCLPNNAQGLQSPSYPMTTMPFQQGMIAVVAPPPYQANMVPAMQGAVGGEAMVAGPAALDAKQ